MNKERLLAIADHLEHGNLDHKIFCFASINVDYEDTPVYGRCGALGCAIGEFPIAFPDLWEFRENSIGLICNPEFMEWRSTERFFDITPSQAEHLFLPNGQNPQLFGGSNLACDATKEQVAANIRAFVKKMEEK